jgi:hypothetical protein
MPSWPASARSRPRSPEAPATRPAGRLAPATRLRASLLGAVLTTLLIGTSVGAALALAADPSPTPRPPTCAELYPAEGPAGIDLQLGCLIRELVGTYTGERVDPTQPARISQWLGPIAAFLVLLLLVALAIRLVRRRLGERLAPERPIAWWQCPACQSINQAGHERCYRCHAPWTPEAGVIPTADRPIMTQRFGGDRKKGGDRPGRSEDDASF